MEMTAAKGAEIEEETKGAEIGEENEEAEIEKENEGAEIEKEEIEAENEKAESDVVEEDFAEPECLETESKTKEEKPRCLMETGMEEIVNPSSMFLTGMGEIPARVPNSFFEEEPDLGAMRSTWETGIGAVQNGGRMSETGIAAVRTRGRWFEIPSMRCEETELVEEEAGLPKWEPGSEEAESGKLEAADVDGGNDDVCSSPVNTESSLKRKRFEKFVKDDKEEEMERAEAQRKKEEEQKKKNDTPKSFKDVVADQERERRLKKEAEETERLAVKRGKEKQAFGKGKKKKKEKLETEAAFQKKPPDKINYIRNFNLWGSYF